VSWNGSGAWPELRVEDWQDTRDTFHLWTQVVGKVRMAHEPLLNHWWNVPLYVGVRGFGTSLITPADAVAFEMDFDLVDSVLRVATVEGQSAEVALAPRSVADFHAEVMATLDQLGLRTRIWTMPVEIEGAIPFDSDEVHNSYDADAVRRFWLKCVQIQRVFSAFRGRFVGKSSPVHLFWGALDLAATRFSGRDAPPHPGGAPNCGPHVMWEAYSQEVSSAGYWPGGPGEEGTFYSYAYPEPEGYRDAAVGPAAARFDTELGEFVLPYEAVRTAADPDATLLEFLQTTYEAAAVHAQWDRAALERAQ
jgi:hypothetical protein